MTRDNAESLMAVYARIGELLNEAHAIIELEPDEEERKRLRRPLGQMMASLWTELQLPIASVYPQLDPDAGR